jgi:heme/copper-type cytochrome/quinol oxidase subunit 2
MEVAKMKKLLIYLVALSLMISCVMAASVTRSMSSSIEPGKELTVTFNVASMEVGKSVAISDTIPSQFTIKEWSVTGATKSDVTYEVKGKEYRWDIPATATTVALTYKIDVPSSASGSYAFDGVYIAPPAKFDELKATLNVATAAPPPPRTVGAGATLPPEEGGMPTAAIIIVIAVIIIGVIIYFIVAKKKKQEAIPK